MRKGSETQLLSKLSARGYRIAFDPEYEVEGFWALVNNGQVGSFLDDDGIDGYVVTEQHLKLLHRAGIPYKFVK
jgi:hypothetical protein